MSNKSRGHLIWGFVMAGATLVPCAALADGEFAQLDLSATLVSGVVSVQRGDLSIGLNYTDAEGDRSGGLSAVWTLPFAPGPWAPTVRIGPSLGLNGPDLSDSEVGGRLVVERYQTTDWGSLYLLADLNSVDSAWFLLGQVGLSRPGITVELSRGGSEDYTETTLAVSRRIEGSPVSLRAGWRFDSEEAFLGFSVNTF